MGVKKKEGKLQKKSLADEINNYKRVYGWGDKENEGILL